MYLQMKRQCKTKRDKAITCDDNSEDRISKLPDEILLQIFSTLPTEDIIPTSVLSKRWKFLWKKMETLKFYHQNHTGNFAENITQALITHNKHPLNALSISVSYICEPFDVGVWTQIAFARGVSKLVFRLNNLVYPVIFPCVVFERSNTLKTLKLMGNIYLDLSHYSVNLHCLKELHLYHVRFDSEYSLSSFLAGCPGVEVLFVELFKSSGVSKFTIIMSKLERLTLGSYECVEENIEIETPCLTFINIRKLHGVQTFSVASTMFIEEAKIAEHSESMTGNLLESTTSAKRLALPSTIMYEIGTTFNKLESLELDTRDDRWWSLLAFMLASSPNLEILKLTGGLFYRGLSHWSPPIRVANCLMSHVHTLVWEHFAWSGEYDKSVAKYILKNASKLQKASFSWCESNTDAQIEARNNGMAELAVAEKASHSCTIIFPKASFWRYSAAYDQDPDTMEFTY